VRCSTAPRPDKPDPVSPGTPGRSAWFQSPPPAAADVVDHHTLFCLPYAGGSAAIYRPWRRAAPAGLAVVPVQPPGRHERWVEPPVTSAESMAEQLGTAMLPLLDGEYSLFGISMGAVVAYELAHWLTRQGRPPAHLFVASYPAPHLPRTAPRVHDSPDGTVVALLAALEVTPPELLADQEMLQLLLPTIRADLAVTETYVRHEREPLPLPITVLRGDTDRHLPADAAAGWSRETSHGCTVVVFDGGHFLLRDCAAAVFALVTETIAGGQYR
jgi:surfactin synthase thioesterase subunit